jgi:hypothetical protein
MRLTLVSTRATIGKTETGSELTPILSLQTGTEVRHPVTTTTTVTSTSTSTIAAVAETVGPSMMAIRVATATVMTPDDDMLVLAISSVQMQ